MRKSIPLLLACGILLAACSGWSSSRVNPTNWFGGSTSASAPQEVTDVETNPLIPQSEDRVRLFSRRSPPPDENPNLVLVETVTELHIDATPSGAIIRAEGLAFRQGAHEARLRLIENEDDPTTLAYEFVVAYPEFATVQGAERTRTLAAARTVSAQDLNGIRTIRVSGKGNVRESRRR